MESDDMDDKEKLIDALKTIKETCKAHEERENGCSRCPLGNSDDDCLLMELTPDNWCINEPGAVWRALS